MLTVAESQPCVVIGTPAGETAPPFSTFHIRPYPAVGGLWLADVFWPREDVPAHVVCGRTEALAVAAAERWIAEQQAVLDACGVSP